jgi:hypothetical protein
MTIWSNVKLFLLNLLVIMFSGLPLVWLLYRRLFSTRTPKDLLQSTTCLQEVFYVMLFSIFLVLLLYLCWKTWFYKDVTETEETSGYFTEMLRFLVRYMDLGTEKIHALSEYILPNYGALLNRLCHWLYKYHRYCRQIVLVFVCLPKIVVAIFFIIDVFYFNRFEYFYLSLYLLILPLIYRLLTYLLAKFYNTNYPEFLNILTITEHHDAAGDVFKTFEFKDEDARLEYDLEDFLFNVYDPVDKLPIALNALKILKEKYTLYTNLLVYSMYSIGWGYLSFYGYFVLGSI